MAEAELKEELGTITISKKVLTDLIQRLGGEGELEAQNKGLRKWFGKNPKVDIEEDNTVSVSLNTSILYGENMREECKKRQHKVKEEIEEKTGLTVNQVNIKVDGVIFPEEEPENKEEE